MASILTPQQSLFIHLFANTKLSEYFYFGGGSALSYHYLQHRYSEDLDFFNFNEFDPSEIIIFIKSVKSQLRYTSIDIQQSFNRNLFFLHFKNDYVLKLEFTYYPFTQVEPPKLIAGVLVDSVLDIATNKLFTISQKPRGRDYFDLFQIIHTYGYDLEVLRMKAKLKFDWHIDPLQLASKLYEVTQHLDDPILTKSIERSSVESFFQTEAKKMQTEILDK